MRKTVNQICDAFGLDVAQLRRIEDLVNTGRLVLREDHWEAGRMMFFSGPMYQGSEPRAPLSSAQLAEQRLQS
jgi:hypothetical protein